jgi:F-type H+-transporting ATPase subunit c
MWNLAMAYFGAGVGSGLAIIGAGMGIGRLAAGAMEGIGRQPAAAGNIQTLTLITAALIEGVCFFALIVCVILATKTA